MNELHAEAIAFFDSLRAKNHDVQKPLRWQYSLRNVPTPHVERVMAQLADRGFIEIEPDFNDIDVTPDSVDDSTLFCISFGFVGVHTAESAADQIVALHEFAKAEGFQIDGWSAGSP